MNPLKSTLLSASLLVTTAFCAVGCGTKSTPVTDGGSAHVYAVASTLSQGDTSTTYVNLMPELAETTLDYTKAREYPGFSTILGVDSKLFISNSDDRHIHRFSVSGDLQLTEEAEVSLADHTSNAAFYDHILVNNQKGYFLHDVLDRAAWNPATMKVTGVIPGPTQAQVPHTRDGMKVFVSYDRGTAVRGNHVFQPAYWVNDSWYKFAPTSAMIVYDGTTDAVLSVEDVPCPNLDKATVAEDGTLYFSNWFYSIGDAYGPGRASPHNCMVRIKPGETQVDATWKMSWNEPTGGHEAAAFVYWKNGKGLLPVFHEDHVASDADPADAIFTQSYRYWWVDLNTGTASQIEGLDWAGAGYYAFHIDGRFFLLLPSADMSVTSVYELLDNGTPKKLFDAKGWAYQLIKVR